MGILSSKYCFRLNDADWWVRVGVTGAGLSYKIKIDGQLVFDEKREYSSLETLRPQTLNVSHNLQDYHLDIGPVSSLGYGVHVYADGRLLYRHKNRDFVELQRHEKVFGKFDKLDPWLEKLDMKDPRPFWKIFLESCMIGLIIGVLYAVLKITLAENGGPDLGNLGTWPIVILAILIAFFWPARFRFIR